MVLAHQQEINKNKNMNLKKWQNLHLQAIIKKNK